jgi:hypothetical protein
MSRFYTYQCNKQYIDGSPAGSFRGCMGRNWIGAFGANGQGVPSTCESAWFYGHGCPPFTSSAGGGSMMALGGPPPTALDYQLSSQFDGTYSRWIDGVVWCTFNWFVQAL